VPWTFIERPDTRTTNVRLGIWLFLASEAMFFGSLFSAYVLLRAGGATWGSAAIDDRAAALVNTGILLAASLALHPVIRLARTPALAVSAMLAAVFLAFKLADYDAKLSAGLVPAANVLLASWFVLTAVHALHVAAGIVANAWVALASRRVAPAHAAARMQALRLYWYFVDLVWIGIVIAYHYL
jgi:heme/copper-type cytochrome/quinol oxidase subunit 3